MDVSGDVCLIPGDNAELYVPSGITVPSCSSLMVYARRTGDSMGACIVDAPAGGCAGIGGAPNTTCSSGAIAGGRITVQGVFYTAGGAGIGFGGMRLGGGSVTIRGGSMTARSGRYAAAKGACDQGTSAEVTITGGTVLTQSRTSGAGIGGGQMAGSICNTCDLTGSISGGRSPQRGQQENGQTLGRGRLTASWK